MYDCIVNETCRKRSIMTEKITVVTSKGHKADVPVALYTADGNLDLTNLAYIIDSAAAYAVKDLDGVEPAGHVADETIGHTAEACHRADACHCAENQHVHMPKITMNEIPTVTMNEIADEDDGEEDLLEDYPGMKVNTAKLHDYVTEAVKQHGAFINYPTPTLIFTYVDAHGKTSVKSVVLSLEETDPANDWFITYADGKYRSFRYDRITSDYVRVQNDVLRAMVSSTRARFLGICDI